MEKEQKECGQSTNNFYGHITNYIVYQSEVTYEGQVNTYNENSREKEESRDETPSQEQFVRAVGKVKALFWGTSSIATIFCVCRDRYGAKVSASEFERQMNKANINCPEGTIRNTMRNNPYMKLPINKWANNGAQERVMVLIDKFVEAIETGDEEMEMM